MGIEARCTQCGLNHESDDRELKHGTGKKHGTERLYCPDCGNETVHNRCGKSVPTGTGR